MPKTSQTGITSVINNIFTTRFGVDFVQLPAEYQDFHLAGDNLKFGYRDLLILLFLIEKELNIKIPDEDIITGEFTTFNKIVKIVTHVIR
jgi:acyl carrier protein